MIIYNILLCHVPSVTLMTCGKKDFLFKITELSEPFGEGTPLSVQNIVERVIRVVNDE